MSSLKTLQEYKNDIKNMSKSLLNDDQKNLIIEILENSKTENLDNIFQLLIQKVKIGFTFDVAPSVDTTQVALLTKDQKMSFVNDYSKHQNNNLIIGENYDVLKNLLALERERERERETATEALSANYDIIYIDPPYNTDTSKTDGNQFYSEKDDVKASKFIYRDKFSRNGWLNMMNERLKMARSLLKDDGVIFVSIDDNEQAYLKVLMDEIFGEENFVANLVWRKKNTGGGSDKSKIEVETEFVICYSKNNQPIWNSHPINKEDYKFEDEYINDRGKYYLTDLDHVSSSSSFQYSASLDYEIQAPDGSMFKNHRNIKNPMSYRYTLGKDLFDFSFNNGFIEIQRKKAKDGTEYWKAYKKNYEKVIIKREEPYQIIPREKGRNFSNLICDSKITTSNGKRNLISIIKNKDKDKDEDKDKDKDFPFPKPVGLIKYIINLISNKNARILDFFAGSGTTAHAVLELNQEDGGNRSFTIVTNDENNIGTNICYERIYRINNGIGTKGESFNWTQKNQPFKANLNVFKTQYFDTSITSTQNDLIKKTYLEMLKDFNIKDINENNINEQNILVSLCALKPIKKGE